MPNCIKCKKTQSKLYDGSLCKGCYSSSLSSNDISIYPGVSNDQIDTLSELPLNWINEPFNNLKGGHLLKMTMHANGSLQSNMDKFAAMVTSLKKQNTIIETKVQKLNDVNEKSNIVDRQESEIDLLKKVVLSQQKFCEETQRKNLSKNLIISGVSTGSIVYCDKELVAPEEKVDAILSSIGIPLNNDQLEIHPFTPSEGKSTRLNL